MAYKRNHCINWNCSKHSSCKLFIKPVSEQNIKLANTQPKKFGCTFYKKKPFNLIEDGAKNVDL